MCVESKRLSVDIIGDLPMRILLGITVVAALVVGAWAIPHGAKQHGTVSIDPASLTATKTNLPVEQYDAF
jgi:hypothetical protein